MPRTSRSRPETSRCSRTRASSSSAVRRSRWSARTGPARRRSWRRCSAAARPTGAWPASATVSSPRTSPSTRRSFPPTGRCSTAPSPRPGCRDLRRRCCSAASCSPAGRCTSAPVSALSGGERRRLALALLVASGANFLVLDEPTNHLDLESREALEAALEAFPGTVLIVSHDRALLDAVPDRIVAVEERGAAFLRRGLGRPDARAGRRVSAFAGAGGADRARVANGGPGRTEDAVGARARRSGDRRRSRRASRSSRGSSPRTGRTWTSSPRTGPRATS